MILACSFLFLWDLCQFLGEDAAFSVLSFSGKASSHSPGYGRREEGERTEGVILCSCCSTDLEERDKKDLILGPGTLTVPIEPVASDVSLHLTRLSVLLSPRERGLLVFRVL